MSNEQKLNRIVKEIDPKDELGKLELAALRFKCTRATPLLLVRPPPGSHICVSMSEVSVTMRSIAWGVGDLNTLISTQTSTMSNNQDVRPRYAREALAFELDTTVRERVLALRASERGSAPRAAERTGGEAAARSGGTRPRTHDGARGARRTRSSAFRCTAA